MKKSLLLMTGMFLLWAILLPAQEPAEYRRIDRHARQAPRELGDNLPRLVEYLTAVAGDDEEKLRAIYTWITLHITYDEEAYQQDRRRINQNLGDILRRQKAICVGYADLLCAMCREAGILCEKISGYSKGTRTATPGLAEPDHAWNAVLLDGEWRLLDATWGSTLAQKNSSFAAKNDLPCFLAAPERFVYQHLPAMPMWQLLDRPVPPAIFSQPADRIDAHLTDTTPWFHFRDSIAAWLRIPSPERSLYEAEVTFRTNPTSANRNQLGHAWMDVAGRLSDQTDTLQNARMLDSLIGLQGRMLDACQQARLLADTLYPWQLELHINTLMNQAVAIYQKDVNEPANHKSTEFVAELLREARRYLDELPPSSLYGIQMRRRCEEYLEVVEQRDR